MKRTVPLLILIAALSGCDDKDLDSIPRSLATPDLQRAAGNIACRTQEEFEQRADIAICGTENHCMRTTSNTCTISRIAHGHTLF